MKKNKPEPQPLHHPPNPPGPPIRPPNPGGGDQPPSTTNVLLLRMIALQQDMNALMLEMQKEMRHNHEESKKCCKELKEELEEIDENVEEILEIVKEILVLVTPPAATDFKLVQGDSMAITGVQAGGKAAFTIFLVPANAAALQSGPTATSSDPLVTVSPNPNDPANPFMVQCSVDASDANASFDLKVDGVNSLAAPITHTFTIPILTAPPPAAVDFDLDQVAVTPLK